MSEPRINDRIRVPEVRLVGPNGEQVGIVRVEDALRLAEEADLDLVEVAPDARPPVCKLMDFGKFKYEAAQKARDARRNQANTVLKEIRFRLKIDPHDYATKKGHVERFLKAGDKVKVMIMFRGREQSRPEMGMRLLQRLAEEIAELGTVESSPRLDGRNMTMVIAPTKRKVEAMQEQRKVRAERQAEREQAPRHGRAERQAGQDQRADETPEAAEATREVIESVEVVENQAPAPVAAAPAETAPAESAAPKAPAAPRAAKAPAAPRAAAPRAAAAKPAAAKAPKESDATEAAGTGTPATPKPAAAPRPAAPKPKAAPAAPRSSSATGSPKPGPRA
nr:translation initiation factor IF-3 [Salana multivorans]